MPWYKTPAFKKLLMPCGAAGIAYLSTLPQLAVWSQALAGVAGIVMGGAHIQRPGDSQ